MSKPTNATDLHTLPHSGLRVPHDRLRVTAYQELPTAAGVAFTAKLYLDGRAVGTVENGGRGGPTLYQTNGSPLFGWRELDAYVAQCITAAGNPAGEDSVLNDLVTECVTARTVARHERYGRTPLRQMEVVAGEHYAVREMSCRKLADDAMRVALVSQLAERAPCWPDQWWQAWNGERWENLTDPPADA